MPLNDEGFCAGGYIDEDAAHIFGPAEFAKGAIVELNSFKIEEVEVGVTVGDFLSYFCKQDDEETQVNIVTGCNSIMYVPCTQNYKLPENIASIELSSAISVSQNNGKYLILVSGTKDTVETSTWERALREYVGFRTYDEANYTKESIINGTTGGGGIKWVVDEARFAGTQLDPSSGHLYKIVDWGTAVSWDTANQRAQSLDSELGMTGYLAEITSATENSVVSGLLGNRNAWLGGKRLSSGSWRWNKSNTTFGYTNWASGAQTTNANLYMKPGGGWNSAPVVTTTSSDKTYVSGWTAAAGASGTKVAAYTAPIYIPADYPNPHTVTVYFNAHSNS